jgi:hypothetical protein
MTSLQSELKHKQAEHDAMQLQINDYLSQGKMIEILGPTNFGKGNNAFRYNNQKDSSDGI